MSSVQAYAYWPDELLAVESDRDALAVVFAVLAAGSEAGGRFRCCCGALVRDRGVLGESFQVDRGAAEQELQMEGGRAAAADAVESVHVLQLRWRS